MARGVRAIVKRKLEACRQHTAWINEYLTWMIETYQPVHPDWAEKFRVAAAANEIVDDLLTKLNEEL